MVQVCAFFLVLLKLVYTLVWSSTCHGKQSSRDIVTTRSDLGTVGINALNLVPELLCSSHPLQLLVPSVGFLSNHPGHR